jgi:hypothetical protein
MGTVATTAYTPHLLPTEDASLLCKVHSVGTLNAAIIVPPLPPQWHCQPTKRVRRPPKKNKKNVE